MSATTTTDDLDRDGIAVAPERAMMVQVGRDDAFFVYGVGIKASVPLSFSVRKAPDSFQLLGAPLGMWWGPTAGYRTVTGNVSSP